MPGHFLFYQKVFTLTKQILNDQSLNVWGYQPQQHPKDIDGHGQYDHSQ
jgi:hypothetical protein